MTPVDPYHPRIRFRWPEGGWIIWNWHTCRWDFVDGPTQRQIFDSGDILSQWNSYWSYPNLFGDTMKMVIICVLVLANFISYKLGQSDIKKQTVVKFYSTDNFKSFKYFGSCQTEVKFNDERGWACATLKE